MGRLFINIISGPSYCTIGAGRESTVLSKLYDMTCFVFLPANMEMCVGLEKLFSMISVLQQIHVQGLSFCFHVGFTPELC